VGSSSEVNSLVSLTATEDMQEKFEELDENRGKPEMEAIAVKTHDRSRDFAIESSGISRSINQLCIIITEAAEEDNHEGNKDVDLQVDKPRSNNKKEKEKIHVSTGEWRIIMSAINHGTEVPADSRREVLMGYQYALHQHKKKLREERDMFMRSRDDNSTSSGGYWGEYSDASECSMERHRDPKHNRRTTAQTREESYAKSLSAQQLEEEEDFVQETPEAALVVAQAYLLTTQPEPGDPREHMHQAAIRSLGLVEDKLMGKLPEEKAIHRKERQ
jgi:selenocysteine-specific translation elongation factor